MRLFDLARDPYVRRAVSKKPLLWLAVGGVVGTVILLTKKKAEAAPLLPTQYGETSRFPLSVPAGWRRATNAEVVALPELSAQANALLNTPGFTAMTYGTLFPFTASDGRMYATWVEQHFHEPLGPAKPWGLHHGVTILARV